jgi:hypothetical protein
MLDMAEETIPRNDDASWPLFSMFFLGFFGAAHSAADREFRRRSWIAFTLLFAGQTVAALAAVGYWPRVTIAVIAMSYLVTAWWRYLSTLPELERRLQLEAVALTYVIGFGVILTLAICVRQPVDARYFLVIEPVRGLLLVVLSRKYR